MLKAASSPAVRHTPAVATTTCSSQWRRDARYLGSPPLRLFVPYPRWFENTYFRGS